MNENLLLDAIDDVVKEKANPELPAPVQGPAFVEGAPILNSAIDEFARAREGKQKLTVLKSKRADPANWEARKELAERYGVDLGFVERNQDRLADLADSQDRETFLQDNPELADFFAQDDNLQAISFDELRGFSGLSWLGRASWQSLKGGQENVDLDMLNYKRLMRTATEEEIAFLDSQNPMQPRTYGADSWFQKGVIGLMQSAPGMVRSTVEGAKAAVVGGVAGAGAGALAGGLVGGLPGAAAGAAGGATTGLRVGFPTGFATDQVKQFVGNAYGEFRSIRDEAGQPLDDDVARVAAIVAGTSAATLNYLSASKLAEMIPGFDRIKGLLTKDGVKAAMQIPAIRTALKRFAGNVLTGTSIEVSTEVAQEALVLFGGELAKIADNPTGEPRTELKKAEDATILKYRRPFDRGEYIKNEDGSISTERTITVQASDGKWINVPTLWATDKGYIDAAGEGMYPGVAETWGKDYDRRNPGAFERYDTVEQAEEAARQASEAGGRSAPYEMQSAFDITSRLGEVGVQTLQVMSILGPLLGGSRLAHDIGRARQAQADQAVIDQIIQHAQGNPLPARLPEKSKAAIEAIAKDGPIQNVYISPEVFQTFFQNPDDLAAYIDEIGIGDEYREAAALGREVEVPIGTFYTSIAATELGQAIRQHVKFSPDIPTGAEADAVTIAWQEAVATIAAGADADIAVEPGSLEGGERIHAELKQAQMDAGIVPDQADAQAALYAKVFTVFADRLAAAGVEADPYSLFQKYGVGVQRVIPGLTDQGRREPVDNMTIGLEAIRRGAVEPLRKKIEASRGVSLVQEIKRRGGLVDEGGNLKAMGATEIIRKGKKKTDKGEFKANAADDMARALWEAGYFPELQERPTPDDLYNAISEELGGSPRYSEQFDESNTPEIERARALVQFADQLAELGLDPNEMADDAIRAELDRVINADPNKAAIFQPAWHGSPHSFDQFKLDAIGTGEGSQAFGWGLYFAGKKEVADHYRQKLTRSAKITVMDDFDAHELAMTTVSGGSNLLTEFAGNLDMELPEGADPRLQTYLDDRGNAIVQSAIRKIMTLIERDVNDGGKTAEWSIDYQLAEAEYDLRNATEERGKARAGMEVAVLRALKKEPINVERGGRLYKVEVPDDGELLDYDKPLAKQPKAVKEKLKAAGFMKLWKDSRSDYSLPQEVRPDKGSALIAVLKAHFGSDKAASLALRDAGIPGHRFLDALSRDQGKGSHNYVVYDDSRVKVEEYFQAATDSAAFSSWFGQSKVVDADGAPLVVYHGTVTDFDTFDRSRANPESDLGAGFYFSNTPDDIAANYASEEGPDLTNKIEQRAEQIEQEDDFEGDHAEAVAQARAEMAQHAGATMPVYLSMQNPAFLGGDTPTFIEGGYDLDPAPYMDEAREELGEGADEYEIEDRARELADENAAGETPTTGIAGMLAAIQEMDESGDIFGVDMDKLRGDMGDLLVDGGDAAAIVDAMGKSEGLAYATDEDGKLISKEIVRRAFEAIGFDGFVDATVDFKFGSQKPKASGKPMAGMSEETVHYVAFRPEQIKSASGNSGAFDPNNPNILFQGEGSGPRGSIQFGEGRTIINLFETADQSTFLHETGHFFLQVFNDIAAQVPAGEMGPNASLAEDWRRTKEYLGIGDDGVISVEAHEKWARTFEAYLFEGKAPSDEVAGIMSRFRSWLIGVYRSIARLNVPINDSIRGVMDRMLATDNEIKAAQGLAEFRPAFKTAADAGMTDAQFADYQATAARAVEKTRRTLEERMLADVARETTAEWKTAKRSIRDQVDRELRKLPVYQAIEYLRTGQAEIVPADTPRLYLDRDSIVEVMGEGALLKMPRSVPPLYRAEGGVHPDILAELFGFGSGRELLTEIMGAQPIGKVIVQETEFRMRQAHGDLLADHVARAREAQAAIANDATGDLLDVEMRVLMRKGLVTSTLRKQDAQRIARQAIRDKKVREAIRTGLYINAVSKAATATEKAIAAGDWVAAVEAKKRQLVAHYMAQESRQVDREVRQAAKYLNRFAGRKRPKGIDPEYLDQIQGILERVDLRTPSQRKRALNAWVGEQRAQGNLVAISEELLDDNFSRPHQRMTVEEFLGVRDAVQSIEHLGKLKNKLLANKKQREFEGVRDELLAAVEASAEKRKPNYGRNPTDWELLKSRGRSLEAGLMKMEQVIDWLDGGNINGPFRRYLWQPIADAEVRETELREKYTAAFAAIFDKLDKKRLAQWVTIPGIREPMKVSDVMAVALNTGNEINHRRILDGEGWDQAQLDAVLATLRPEEIAAVQEVWDAINGMWPEIEAIQKRLTGVAPPKVEARPVEINGVTLAGGYFPIVYDPARSHMAADQAAANADKMFEDRFLRPETRHGFTNERVGIVRNRPLFFNIDAIGRHMVEVIHDVTHREALMDAYKMLTNPDVRTAIEDRYSPELYQQMIPWLRSIAHDNHVNEGLAGAEALLKGIRSRATIVAMGFRVSTMLAQVAGYSSSLEMVSIRSMAGAMKDFVTSPLATWREVEALSGAMRIRSQSLDRDIRERLRELTGKTGAADRARRFAFYGIGYMDRVVVGPTWLAAYRDHLSENPADKEGAIAHADKVIRLTQGGGGAKDLAAWTRKNEATKLLTMFYSYFSAYYNRQRNWGRDARRAIQAGEVREFPQLLARQVFMTIGPAILGELLVGRGPDEEESYALWAARRIALMPLMAVPIVRDVAGYLDKGFGYSFTPAARTIEEAVIRPYETLLKDVVDGDFELRKGVKTAINATGYWFNLPTGQLATSVDNVWKAIEEDDFRMRDLVLTRPKEGSK